MTPEEILSELERDAAPGSATPFVRIAAGYLARTRERAGRVTTALTPEEMYAVFDEPLPRHGQPLDALVARVEEHVVRNANHLADPRCAGHQVSPPLPAAIWTDMLISALNQSLAVREMSPSLTAVETVVVRWMCALAGFGDGAGGVLTSGGTEATFTALLAARNRALPESWREGVGASNAVLVCGEHAHYSTTRAAGELGLGMRKVEVVPSDGLRMDTAALRERLTGLRDRGATIVAVVATAGSTATGTFDDIADVAAACDEHDAWLHVDAAHGATALFSERHRWRLAGIERARSISWDPHKMMLLPLPAGTLLMRDERDLERAFAQDAPYLFHAPQSGARRWDQGLRSFQCSRRADALKLWVALQRHGAEGIAAIHDHLCATTAAFHRVVAEADDFEAMHEPESNILCFRWVGRSGRSPEVLDEANGRLRERLNASGHGWMTTTMLGGRRVLRVTVMNPRTTLDDLGGILEVLRREAVDLE